MQREGVLLCLSWLELVLLFSLIVIWFEMFLEIGFKLAEAAGKRCEVTGQEPTLRSVAVVFVLSATYVLWGLFLPVEFVIERLEED